MKKRWMLWLEPEPRPGSWNMAADEFLLAGLGESPATLLRFYAWTRPTASLGCSQDAALAVDEDFCRRNGVDIVRRITGGKMVLHDREVTYSLSSSDAELFGGTVRESYGRISEALALGLKKLGLHAVPAGDPPGEYVRGPLPCFSHPGRDELQVDGKKILGSAQKRLGSKFLQHGSLPLDHDASLLRSVSRMSAEAELRMTSLAELLGRPVSWLEAAARLAEGFAEWFCVALEETRFPPGELVEIGRLQERKYESEPWTFRAQAPSPQGRREA